MLVSDWIDNLLRIFMSYRSV